MQRQHSQPSDNQPVASQSVRVWPTTTAWQCVHQNLTTSRRTDARRVALSLSLSLPGNDTLTLTRIVELYFLWAVFWDPPPAHRTAGDCSDGIICNHVECRQRQRQRQQQRQLFPKKGVVRLNLPPAPLLRLRQVVVDCLMLSKVLAVITLMCHFYSPATPYASPLHELSLSLSVFLFISLSFFPTCLSLVSSPSALFIFYSASACSSGFPAIAFSLTHTLSFSSSTCHSVALSLSLFGVFYGVCRHFAKLISGLFFW